MGYTFQSPLHRGVLFNVQLCRMRIVASACHFSPLFIGESSLTADSRSASQLLAVFQSPLHRGVLFNAALAAVSHVAGCSISVPSSSGSPL